MTNPPPITCLFVDIGGVLLTDGWDHGGRDRAAGRFGLDRAALEERHDRNWTTFEEGRMTLDLYLDRVVFWEERPFSRADFRAFLFEQSRALPGMIELIARLKVRHGLKVLVVSNEAREINAHRIRAFGLDRFVDAFVSSCYVGLRKPDEAIFRLALDLAQVPPERVLYLENTRLFVEVAAGLGVRGIHHTGLEPTRARLAAAGLPSDPPAA